jgi:hypothetical protein
LITSRRIASTFWASIVIVWFLWFFCYLTNICNAIGMTMQVFILHFVKIIIRQ